MRLSVLIVLLMAGLVSCKNDVEDECVFVPNTSALALNLKFESLEAQLPAIKSKEELVDFFSQHTTLRDHFFKRQAYPSDSAFINELYRRFSNPHIDTLLLETQKVFGDGTQLKEELTTAFSNLMYYYPDFQVPKVQTIISGLENDMFVSDTVVIISLDYFLGQGARFRPNMFEYMLRRYEKEFIAPSLMLLYGIDSRYNKTELTDHTALAEMIAYGKAYYFAKHMLPCTPDSVLIGYTAKEMAGARANQNMIWKKMMDDEAFYSTSQVIKRRYIAERPKTYEVGDQAPGRLGTWIGWLIVNRYAERNSDLTLPQMMSVTDAKEILKESKYRPL